MSPRSPKSRGASAPTQRNCRGTIPTGPRYGVGQILSVFRVLGITVGMGRSKVVWVTVFLLSLSVYLSPFGLLSVLHILYFFPSFDAMVLLVTCSANGTLLNINLVWVGIHEYTSTRVGTCRCGRSGTTQTGRSSVVGQWGM